MRSEVEQFYDCLADTYELIIEDWDRAIARQAGILDALIRSKRGRGCLDIHDCACGIGTQAIGFASLGRRVSGSDLSRAAVQRAANEAAKRGLSVQFRVSDMTSLAEYSSGEFEVLAAFDDALNHLPVDQLAAAASTSRRVLLAPSALERLRLRGSLRCMELEESQCTGMDICLLNSTVLTSEAEPIRDRGQPSALVAERLVSLARSLVRGHTARIGEVPALLESEERHA